MASNRYNRRKERANTRTQNRRARAAAQQKVGKKPENPVEKLNFFDSVQRDAPVEFHLSTMFSQLKIGNLQFLPLYMHCMEKTSTTAPSWKVFRRAQRALTLAQYFDYACSIPGSKAECGVFRGFSALLTNLVGKMGHQEWTGKDYYLIDSFEGLSEPELNDAIGFTDGIDGGQTPLISHQAGAFATPLEEVKKNLSDFPDLVFQKGWIPEVFKSLPEVEWSFVHIDVDLYRPTLETLEYFFPRIAPGGIIINDDYSSPLFPGGGNGWNDFFDQVKKPFIILDSGQAVFVNT